MNETKQTVKTTKTREKRGRNVVHIPVRSFLSKTKKYERSNGKERLQKYERQKDNHKGEAV